MPNPLGYLSVNDAARLLNVTPRAVDRLVESNELRAVILVEAASLAEYQGQQQ